MLGKSGIEPTAAQSMTTATLQGESAEAMMLLGCRSACVKTTWASSESPSRNSSGISDSSLPGSQSRSVDRSPDYDAQGLTVDMT
ncbi:hypothetical protein OOU_Y34scaffold00790g16 [Pyricularia oryzae Y34]|uniref:Uncharacterized protein n=2 Tax=Pyricularia oryzae TaxID=318829 RepID=A0AA97NQ57_PYRO3|nr:hypothetical protein OOU_Y34scaffold00790g16 [Pyricularia oryzae Y34]